MVTIELKGGLGNQLFQIFACIAYAMRTNQDFQLPAKSLGGFDTYYDEFLLNLRNKVENFQHNRIYKQPHYHYTPIPKLCNPRLFGYFQSEKFFDDYFDEIYNLIAINERKREVLTLHADYFEHPCISLHFRIGDYAKQQDKFPVQPKEYYVNALTKIITQTHRSNYNVLVFGQHENKSEILHNTQVLSFEFPHLNFLKVPDNIPDWHQMLMMSLCDHNIIANSSFSWWGAYLNTGNNLVTCPAVWLGPAKAYYDTSDLIPEDWIKI